MVSRISEPSTVFCDELSLECDIFLLGCGRDVVSYGFSLLMVGSNDGQSS